MHKILFFALISAALLCGCGRKNTAVQTAPVVVRTAPLTERNFQNHVETQGVVEPLESAVLSAVVPGKIEHLTVKEGDPIKAGQLLFQTDRENMENAVNLAKETLHIAQTRFSTHTATLAKAKVSLEKAQIDYNRNKYLFDVQSVSSNTYENAKLAMDKAKLAVDEANAAIDAANAEVGFAAAALKIAQKKLRDTEIFAPYDGIVTAKLKNENEFCGAGTPVLKIEKNGQKRVSALINGIYLPEFHAEKTLAKISIRGKVLCTAAVTTVMQNIDPVSRTFEVKANLPDKAAVSSGMLCNVNFLLSEHKGAALPSDAVLYRAKNQFAVFTAENGKAVEIPVQAGAVQGGYTEILNGAALAGKQIVVSGQYFLHDGDAVSLEK